MTQIYFGQERIEQAGVQENTNLIVEITTSSQPNIGVDESYVLKVTENKINLKANTTMGALKGFQTLNQIVKVDSNGYFIPVLEINDAPRFKWRGMMVDVARHFLPIELLRKNIDAMAMVKLNVLHLHLSDDEGFRVESKLFPKLHENGSYGNYYTQSQLKELVKYASDRGILIVPEFDLPGHTRSWFAAYPELASAPGPYKPGPRFIFDENASRQELGEAVKSAPTPTIDPSREEVYTFLDQLFGEMVTIFTAPYFHIGADENNGAAWRNNPDIVRFMKRNKLADTHELHSYFVNRLYEIVKKHGRTMIAWQEAFSKSLPKDVMVQAWIPEGAPMEAVPPKEIAESGNSVLISTGFYLDLFLPSHVHYSNPEYLSDVHDNVLGGEAALWSELVDVNSFENRAWPRAAAIAERLWSPVSITDINNMYNRLYALSDDLEANGMDHRLNTRRWLGQLANGTDISAPAVVLETLAPFQGYRRLATIMMMPASLKYETVPLVNLADIVSVDSEMEWKLRTQIQKFLDGDINVKFMLEEQFNEWKDAALKTKEQIKGAPNLKMLETYADRLIRASEIGLLAISASMDDSEKKSSLEELGTMKVRTDAVEIRILDEIEALLSGELKELTTVNKMY
ncbi:beta-N-acetylhexosaminidase [Maribacter flavus]|uniref:beta-N-acetylhexosaminidase n=1 Tax=Maribacter flavus TaxID=1658664 RepID=A0A5B2TNI0_9FLAO|nr:family 20 glycosylhydrolase [Maribacter flavus]KAA2215769.1 family 20 glycosylhydrolase [Maribacter flavus]